MVEEILYTSAEKGLKQGSRGFCTVVSTAGMSPALAERLESMSGYRHAFPLHDPQASMNPVCFSHMTTRLAGKSLHVISRVADAGQDYTGRSNKLAHHLVIDNVASMLAGPARLMMEPGVLVDRWDGNVRNVPPRELRCAALPASIPLVAWQSLTGDEGWAGAIAEQLLQNPAPLSIIFNPGTDTLTLIREVLDLIPAAQRWNVTFSTYFTRLLAGAECQLRFVLNDTPEATSLRNDARARVIDLTEPLPAATGGTLVAMARQGQITPQEPGPTQTASAVRSQNSADISTKEAAAEITVPKPVKPALTPLVTSDKPRLPRDVPPPMRVNSRKGAWIGVTLAVSVVTIAGILISLRPETTKDAFADLMKATLPQDQMPTETEEARTTREHAEKERLEQNAREQREKLAAEAAKRKSNDEKMTSEQLAEKQAELAQREAIARRDKDARDTALMKEGPFAFIRGNPRFEDRIGQWLFNLPKSGQQYDGRWPQLRANGAAISLLLCEGAKPLFSACSYQLELKQDAARLNEWIVLATQAGTIEPIARYTVEELPRDPAMIAEPDRELRFEWLQSASRESMASELLRWWPLQIQVGTRKAVLLQRRPEIPEIADGHPTWRSLANSEPIPVINTNAIKAVGFDQTTASEFTIEFAQADFPTQKMVLPISAAEGTDETDDAETQEAADDSPESKAPTKYFYMVPPFELFEEEPEVTEKLTGFGKLQLNVRQNAAGGLTLSPKITLVLRLPQKKNLEKLPDSSTNTGLKSILKTPQLLAEWNPKLAEAAIKNIQSERESSRNDIRNWYTQAMKPLPKITVFKSDAFAKLASSALKEVQSVVPNCRRDLENAKAAVNRLDVTRLQGLAGGQQILDNARLKLSQAENAYFIASEQHEPRIEAFAEAMKKMSREMTLTQDELLKDYTIISSNLKSCVEAMEQVHIRCTLSGDVSTEKCDTGSKVVIFFLETTSPNWPAAVSQQEAK